MDVAVRELKSRSAMLELSATTSAQVNAIRRVLVADVPKLAIEDVEFHLGPIRDEATGKDYDSSTSMFDEGVALRLGLLPIPTDLGQFRKRSECTCGGTGCPSCQVMYSIDRKGPCTVYARDVVPLGDPTLAIIEPEIPIVRLGARQALLAYATAVVGTAREHAKWQVAQAVGLSPRVEIKVSKKAGCSDACLKRAVESLPDGVVAYADGKITILNETQASMAAGIDKACPHGSIQLEWADDRFFFRFETDGSLTAREALRFAIKDLKRRYEELREAILAVA